VYGPPRKARLRSRSYVFKVASNLLRIQRRRAQGGAAIFLPMRRTAMATSKALWRQIPGAVLLSEDSLAHSAVPGRLGESPNFYPVPLRI